MKCMILFFMTILILLVGRTDAQNKLISNVPDFSQPPQQTLPSTSDISNYCSPFAALNIVVFWENRQKNPYAFGAAAGLQPDILAEYIGWYMATNGQGSPNRMNVLPLKLPGTLVIDQMNGMLEYLESDSQQVFGFPYPFPPSKRAVYWDVLPEPPDFAMYSDEIDRGNPVKLDFLHWNIWPAGLDTIIGQDTVSVYGWGNFVPSSGSIDERDPVENWNGEEGDLGIGHAVTGVGYLKQFFVPATPGPPLDFAVVHDNWANTPEKIAVPWQNVQAFFHLRLPDVPDIAVVDLYTRRDSVITDTLYAMQPFDMIAVIKNLAGPWFKPFILISSVRQIGGTVLATDTSYQAYPGQPFAGDSVQIILDSIYVPQSAGQIDLRAEIFWDLNGDSLINDPPDKDNLNDDRLINRTILWRQIPVLIEMIPGVPDHNQPPTVTLPSTLPGSFCAPMATVNILWFWDIVAQYPAAKNVTASLPPQKLAEYIGWFYDTNDRGNPAAWNGTTFPSAAGTYVADQDSFLWHFIRWDTLNPYMAVAPTLPVAKKGYDWTITGDHVLDSVFYQGEIDAGRPAKLDFSHWNIIFTGTILTGTQDQDTVYLYEWGSPVGNSQMVDPEAPEESWNLEEGNGNIGHAVTGVGYFRLKGFHAIVHDNWSSTHKAIGLPWQNWQGTLAMDPTAPVRIESVVNNIPRAFRLHQNRPNPFNQTTIIRIELPEEQHTILEVFDILGQKITVLVDRALPSGTHQFRWDAEKFPTGMYIYRLETERYQSIRKCVLLK